MLPELESILGRPVINRYGMTEGHVITSLPLDGPWPQGSVGLPLDGVEVRVVDDDGTPAAPGEVGSVQLRGPNLFREYWRRPDATREAFASGWFDTGDLGSRDARGFLTLVGRKNDLIITNGFNVYPQVVERVINECPGVRESAVLGMPDKRRGERVVAAVVRADEALTERATPHLPRRSAGRLPAAGRHRLRRRTCRATPWAKCSRELRDQCDDQLAAVLDASMPNEERVDDRPGLDLAGGPGGGDRAELHDRGQSGVRVAGAGLGDRDLPGAGLGAAVHGRRGPGRLSHGSVPDAGGRDAAIHPGPGQRHARPGGPRGGAGLPGERRA